VVIALVRVCGGAVRVTCGTTRNQGSYIENIDGKTLRRSFDRAASQGAMHMVSVWANANRLVFGQLKVDDKSNEITAIPQLLKMLELEGAIGTIDAMGCQKAIAQTITEQGAKYVLALKDNHPTLPGEVQLFFEDVKADRLDDITSAHHTTIDADHGRLESRHYWSNTYANYEKLKEG
jgi:predicted transposase YbfD/YdcC